VWLALAPDLNLYNPVYTPVTTAIFSGPTSFGHSDLYTAINTFGVYARDHVKWNRWTLTLGGREDWANLRQDDREAGTQAKQDVSAFSGRVGLTYQGEVSAMEPWSMRRRPAASPWGSWLIRRKQTQSRSAAARSQAARSHSRKARTQARPTQAALHWAQARKVALSMRSPLAQGRVHLLQTAWPLVRVLSRPSGR